MQLSNLLERFEKLDQELKKEYWKNHANIDAILKDYILILGNKLGLKIKDETDKHEVDIRKEKLNIDGLHPFIKIIEDMIILRKNIAQELFHHPCVLGYNLDVMKKIKNLKKKDGAFFDTVYQKHFDEDMKDLITLKHFSEIIDVLDALFPEVNIAERIIKIAPYVIFKNLPDIMWYHITNLKQGYAFGQFEACICYCRVLIEISGSDYIKHKKNINYNARENEWSIYDIIEKLKPFINNNIYRKVHKIRKTANNYLHRPDFTKETSEHEALEAIKTTFEFIENLYGC
jgi:uncharacterized protein (UPF0335 family)